jgi:hypothetical protein
MWMLVVNATGEMSTRICEGTPEFTEIAGEMRKSRMLVRRCRAQQM